MQANKVLMMTTEEGPIGRIPSASRPDAGWKRLLGSLLV